MYMCGNGYYTPAVSTISLLGFNSIIFVVFHCIEINEREVIAFRLCLTKLIFSFDFFRFTYSVFPLVSSNSSIPGIQIICILYAGQLTGKEIVDKLSSIQVII